MQRLIAIFAIVFSATTAAACEQYRKGDEVIDFIEDRTSFVLVNIAKATADLYYITGAGTETSSLMASASPERVYRFEYGADSVKLGDLVFVCE